MRNALQILALASVAAAGPWLARAAGPEEPILQAEKEWAAAVTAQNFQKLEQILHDDLIYAHSTGVIETKSQYLGKLRSGAQKYDAIDHHSTTIKTHGDAAVAHSIVTMKGSNPAGRFDNKLMMIHTWVKQGGGWRLLAHQTTELKQ